MRAIVIGDIVEDNGKTIRENNLERTHNIPLGALVEVKYDKWHGNGACEKIHARLFVTLQGRDCDGSPLYWLATAPIDEWCDSFPPLMQKAVYRQVGGFGEESLTVVELTDKVKKGDGALCWEDE